MNFIPAGKYRATSEMHTTRFLQVDETPNCNLLCKGASADGCKTIVPARWGTLWEYGINFSCIAQWFALCTTSSWPQGVLGLMTLSPLPIFVVCFQLCMFCQLKCSCNCMFSCILLCLTVDWMPICSTWMYMCEGGEGVLGRCRKLGWYVAC